MPPMCSSEITKLIKHMKQNKASGYDFISAEAIQNSLDRWVPVLAPLFTYIDNHTKILDDWGLAFVILISS